MNNPFIIPKNFIKRKLTEFIIKVIEEREEKITVKAEKVRKKMWKEYLGKDFIE